MPESANYSRPIYSVWHANGIWNLEAVSWVTL